METKVKTRQSRAKHTMSAMLPVKQWLTIQEACSYMDMSINHLSDLMAQNNFTISVINKRRYYKISELKNLIESNIIIRQTA
jgi:hypothetical protein